MARGVAEGCGKGEGLPRTQKLAEGHYIAFFLHSACAGCWKWEELVSCGGKSGSRDDATDGFIYAKREIGSAISCATNGDQLRSCGAIECSEEDIVFKISLKFQLGENGFSWASLSSFQDLG
jgi:hypothetical protein